MDSWAIFLGLTLVTFCTGENQVKYGDMLTGKSAFGYTLHWLTMVRR